MHPSTSKPITLLLTAFCFVLFSCGRTTSNTETVNMNHSFYTHAAWHVKEGKQQDFIAAWKELGKIFASLPDPPAGEGTLIQSLSDTTLFYSFGPWKNMEDIEAMRNSQQAREGIQKLMELCSEATPASYRVVAVSE